MLPACSCTCRPRVHAHVDMHTDTLHYPMPLTCRCRPILQQLHTLPILLTAHTHMFHNSTGNAHCVACIVIIFHRLCIQVLGDQAYILCFCVLQVSCISSKLPKPGHDLRHVGHLPHGPMNRNPPAHKRCSFRRLLFKFRSHPARKQIVRLRYMYLYFVTARDRPNRP